VLLCASAVAASIALGLAVALLPFRDLGTLALIIGAALVAIVPSAGRQRALLTIGALAYVGALQWVYVDWVVPSYAYSGLIESGVEGPALAIVTVIAVAPAAWLPVGMERPSEVILWPLYLFAYVPAAIIPIHVLGPDLAAVLPLELALAVAFATLGFMQRLPRMTMGWPGIAEQSFTRLLVILGVGAIPYLIVTFAPTSPPPDLQSVYVTRAVYTATLTTTSGAGYIVSWLGNVIYPFLMALGAARSRRMLLILGIVGQLLIYTITGFKSNLLSILFVPLLYLAIRYGGRLFGTLLAWASVLVLALSAVATSVTGSTDALALFVVRIAVVPGQLTAYYYDFFNSHATYLLSWSFLRWFSDPPYAVGPPYLIGTVYFHSPALDANANLWADAMANFGLVGVIPFTIVLGAVLWILDSVASGRDLRVIGPVVALASLSLLTNGALFTQLLTGGIGLIVGFVALMPRSRGPTASAVPRGP
jgi:hypothetical protein